MERGGVGRNADHWWRHGAPAGRGRSLGLGVLLAACLLLAGCAATQPNIFRPGGSAGHDIRTLAIQVLAILSVVLLVVWALLAFVIIRFRKRPESEASQTRGNLRIEIVWTLIPAVIVTVLFVLTVRTTAQLAPPDRGAQFTVTGHQWWWEFGYPAEGFKTANEIHVAVDRPVNADLVSPDVIHSFWVPQMGGKVDMIPGRVNHTRFIPLASGRYLGECAEFCGFQHGQMRFLLIVESAEEFSAWVRAQRRPAAEPQSAAAVAGAEVAATVGCGGCHTIRGTSLKGAVGPDLTHFGSRGGIGAWTLPNTPQNLLSWLQDPQKVKPKCLMPRVPLPPEQLRQLVAYLEELK